MTNTNDVSAIASRMHQPNVTVLHVAATALCAVGFMFDLMEIALGSVLSAVFSSPPHAVPREQLSLLLSSVYIGAILGAPGVGWWADRHGRQTALTAVLLWLCAMSFAAAFVDGATGLTWVRGLAGLALGAYPPLMISYLTDILPPRWRGAMIFVTVGVASLGPVAGVFLVRALGSADVLGLEAWRWGFLAGAAGAGVCGLLFRLLPESPHWLLAQGRTAEADAACKAFEQSRTVLAAPAAGKTPDHSRIQPLAGKPSIGRRRAFVGSLFLLSPWSTVAFPLLTGALLTQRGFKLSDALLYVGLSNFGPLLGALLSASIIDRIDRKTVLAVCTLMMLASGGGFVMAETPVWLVATSIAFSLSSFIYISAMNLYGAELFPVETRAASISGSWALNRLGAAIAPLLLLPLLGTSGPVAMFTVIAATLAATLVLLWFGPAGQQRQTVS